MSRDTREQIHYCIVEVEKLKMQLIELISRSRGFVLVIDLTRPDHDPTEVDLSINIELINSLLQQIRNLELKSRILQHELRGQSTI